MKAKEMMDKEFVFVSKDDSIVDVSIKMEESRRFTAPVLDSSMKLVGWITSFNITEGLREGKKTISEVMSPVEDIMSISEDEPARNVVISASKNKLISIPIINEAWDGDKCQKCQMCIPDCPTGAISFDYDKDTIVRDKDKCLRCSICYQTCPFSVIKYYFAKFNLDTNDNDEEVIHISVKASQLAERRA